MKQGTASGDDFVGLAPTGRRPKPGERDDGAHLQTRAAVPTIPARREPGGYGAVRPVRLMRLLDGR